MIDWLAMIFICVVDVWFLREQVIIGDEQRRFQQQDFERRRG